MRSTYLHQPGTTKNYFDCLTEDASSYDDFSPVAATAKSSGEKIYALDHEPTQVDLTNTTPSSKFPIPGEGVLKSVPGCSYLSRLTALLTMDGLAHNFV